MPTLTRECEGCNVCCTAMKVSALNKPAGTPCSHQSTAGCGMYATRPEVCRVWYCMWVRDDGRVFTDDERPDKSGVFFTASDPDAQTGAQTVYAHETAPDAALQPAARAMIDRLAAAVPIEIIPARQPTTPLTVEGQAVEQAA